MRTNIKIKAMETSKQFLGFNCVRDDDDDDYDDDGEAGENDKDDDVIFVEAKWIRSHLFERRSREKLFFLTYELTKTENTPLNRNK